MNLDKDHRRFDNATHQLRKRKTASLHAQKGGFSEWSALVVELVDTAVFKTDAGQAYGFESRPGHQY